MTVDFEYFCGRVSKGIVFFLMTVWTLIVGFMPMIINASTGGNTFEGNPERCPHCNSRFKW